jgi:hypothetical protein
MEWWQYVTVGVAVLSLLLNVSIAIVGATWGVARIRIAVSEAIEQHRQDFDARLSSAERVTGEGMAAIRGKMHEIELWARDTFVRRDSFLAVTNEIKGGLADLGNAIGRRLDRIENRMMGRPPEG